MSGANHIVGGTVFTGIYLSMWDTNVFSQPLFLFFTAFFAVLPDIDHTKSPIGTLFYPIAKYLDKKHGHRTITHSLICYVLLIILVGSIERIISDKRIITSIFIWSYGSHLILDMITKQGVPLFYPFKKIHVLFLQIQTSVLRVLILEQKQLFLWFLFSLDTVVRTFLLTVFGILIIENSATFSTCTMKQDYQII